MKQFILFLIIFKYSFASYSQPQFQPYITPTQGQSLHTHGDVSDFPTLIKTSQTQGYGISEDFGPRQLGADLYQWHGGIDYNSYLWIFKHLFKILAYKIMNGPIVLNHKHTSTKQFRDHIKNNF